MRLLAILVLGCATALTGCSTTPATALLRVDQSDGSGFFVRSEASRHGDGWRIARTVSGTRTTRHLLSRADGEDLDRALASEGLYRPVSADADCLDPPTMVFDLIAQGAARRLEFVCDVPEEAVRILALLSAE